MIVGDSGTYDAAPAIEAQFRAMGTVDDIDTSFPGFGISRDPAGWRRTWPGLVDQYRPVGRRSGQLVGEPRHHTRGEKGQVSGE